MGNRTNDIYGRKPRSNSRGRTAERILAMQHAPHVLPGAEQLLGDVPAGSIADAVQGFHSEWVASQPVTGRRTYERTLVLLLRDLDANGPGVAAPADELSQQRLVAHLDWRVASGLAHPLELVRAAVLIARLATWTDEHHGTSIAVSAPALRAHARALADTSHGEG